MRYQVTEIPDEVPAQYLLRDGQVLGLDWSSGKAAIWNAESGITTIPSPDGNKWSQVFVSPGGRFLGATAKPDNTRTYYAGELGSNLSPVAWPTSLPDFASQGSSSSGGTSGSITICVGPCPPVILPPPFIPQPPIFAANAINDDGVIAGTVYVNKSSPYIIRMNEIHAFRLYPDGRIDVTKDNNLQATSVNNRGDALVNLSFFAAPICAGNAKLWTDDGQLISPDPLPGYTNLAFPVLNDQGEISGTAANEVNETTSGDTASVHLQGFRWTPGTGSIALDLLHGFRSGIVHGSNNNGIVIGEATNSNSICGLPVIILDPAETATVAVMWKRNGHVINLNTVAMKDYQHRFSSIPSLISASTINDYGQILASGFDGSNKVHSYLLSPIRELHSDVDKRHRYGSNDDSTEDED